MPDEPEDLRDPHEHTLLEDIYAMFTGCTMLALGLVLLKSAGIVTAGVAGIALLVSYKIPIGVGLLFFLINIPFLLLGATTLGREFMIKTVIAILTIFLFASIARSAMDIAWVHPAFAALVGGTSCGMGILALLRHNTGVGGVNIIALWAQKSRGLSVGRLHMALDGLILMVAAVTLSLEQMGWSLLSILATNFVLIAYHKPGRYLGH